MGLKIWEPSDSKPSTTSRVKDDPTAHGRSAIRRRVSIHGRSRRRDLTHHDYQAQLLRRAPSAPQDRTLPPYQGDARDREHLQGANPITVRDETGNLPPPESVLFNMQEERWRRQREALDAWDASSSHPSNFGVSRSTAILSDIREPYDSQPIYRTSSGITTATRTDTRPRRREELHSSTDLLREMRTNESNVRIPPASISPPPRAPSPPQIFNQPSRLFPSILDSSIISSDATRSRSLRPRSRRRPTSSELGDFPPLRRFGRRRVADEIRRQTIAQNNYPTPSPPTGVDGLGDRDRSWSPESDADQWESLITTITPDPHIASTSTSFQAQDAPVEEFSAEAGDGEQRGHPDWDERGDEQSSPTPSEEWADWRPPSPPSLSQSELGIVRSPLPVNQGLRELSQLTGLERVRNAFDSVVDLHDGVRQLAELLRDRADQEIPIRIPLPETVGVGEALTDTMNRFTTFAMNLDMGDTIDEWCRLRLQQPRQ